MSAAQAQANFSNAGKKAVHVKVSSFHGSLNSGFVNSFFWSKSYTLRHYADDLVMRPATRKAKRAAVIVLVDNTAVVPLARSLCTRAARSVVSFFTPPSTCFSTANSYETFFLLGRICILPNILLLKPKI